MKDKIIGVLILGGIIIGIMWALEIGPFKKYYPPLSPYSGSYEPSFTGNSDSSSGAYILRTVSAYYDNGNFAGKYEIIQRGDFEYARRQGETNEYIVSKNPSNGYGFFFWNGATYLYYY